MNESIKQNLIQHGIKPDRSAGQNFLLDMDIIKKITQTAKLKADDTVLEIGAGPGNLTKELSTRVKRVIAIESDQKIFTLLKKNMASCSNVEIYNKDIIRWWEQQKRHFLNKPYKIVANLPYNITGLVLRTFVSRNPKPLSMTVLVQEEVADRLVAKKGKMSKLSVMVQHYGTVEKIFRVSRSSFWPAPNVDSAVVEISKIKKTHADDVELFRLIRVGFSSKRKQLHNNLKVGYKKEKKDVEKAIKDAKLSEKVRAQDLSPDDWKELCKILQK
ncbi:ribosomal RNA small subunit methyltransferase A [Patescibacteria group bacterium]|nr:ribosomal RNA small subunit methyltransferase A [Patescibacteria group bacterium]MBU1890799.1 ribosomal RNA small subunit methyltransferase A [Patescibacteria group bacterium]